MSKQNRNVPLLTKIEMSPFWVLVFGCSLSLPVAKPCGARRAERLGRSEGQTQRMDGRSPARADFLNTSLFSRRISLQERLGATIPNSVDP
jgi:hypothetical protein